MNGSSGRASVIGARFQNPTGGTGLRPVVSGVPLETVVGHELALIPAINQQWMTPGEIRRDAGFNGRDARATHLKYSTHIIATDVSDISAAARI
jgi:hypothetical protein